MTFSFCDVDYSESSVEKKKKVNKTMFQFCSLLCCSINLVSIIFVVGKSPMDIMETILL